MATIHVTLPEPLLASVKNRQAAYKFITRTASAVASSIVKVVPSSQHIEVVLNDLSAVETFTTAIAAIGGTFRVLDHAAHDVGLQRAADFKKAMENKESDMVTSAEAVRFGSNMATLAKGTKNERRLAHALSSVVEKATTITASGLRSKGIKRMREVDEDDDSEE